MIRSSSLSQEEQKKMHARMEQALCLNHTAAAIIKAPSDAAVRKDKLRKDWSRTPVGSKMKLRVKKVFSVRDETEFLLQAKLQEIKTVILSRRIPYVFFPEKKLGPELASVLYELYRFTLPLRPILERIFSDKNWLKETIRQFLDRRIPGAKIVLTDFISLDEMKEIFFRTESRLDLTAEISARLQNYCSILAPGVLDAHGGSILPLHYLRDLAFFPYEEFFHLFQPGPDGNPPAGNPVFGRADINPAVDYLERLYCVLYPFRNLEGESLLHPEIAEACSRKHASGALRDPDSEDENSGLKFLRTHAGNLVTISRRILENVPLAEIIRYFKNDPYYKLMIYPPRLRLSGFYVDAIRLKIFSDFEEIYAKVRTEIPDDIVRELYGGEPEGFEFYMNEGLGLLPKSGNPGFIHHRSLNIMQKFIRLHYHAYIQGLVHVLNRAVTNRMRDSFNMILFHASGIEDLFARINEFDYSFSPDSEDGKNMLKLKFTFDRDISQQRACRVFVARKDKEARDLLEKGLGHIEKLLSGLKDMQDDKSFLSDVSTRIKGIENTVGQSTHSLFLAGRAIRHVSAIERGSL